MNSPKAKSKSYNLEILDKNPLDLCGKEFQKKVIIAPYMGTILKSDSLYGFELSIKYDPDIVQISEVYYTNTISQFFEYKNAHYYSETNEIVFDGMVSASINTPPVAGDLPLVAFGGNFIGDCDDIAEFTFNYFYPIDGFSGKIDTIKSLKIIGQIVDKPTRSIGFEIEDKNRTIQKDSTLSVPINLDMGELNSLDYWKVKVTIDVDSINVTSFDGSNSVEVLNVTKPTENSYLVDLKVDDTVDPTMKLNLKSYKYDSSMVNIKIETVETTECACATRFPNSSFEIKNIKTKSSPTSVSDNYNSDYELVNNIIIPKSAKLNISIYNINGMLIDEKVCNVNQVYDTKQLSLGIYFVKITSKNRIKLIKIINN